MTNGSYAAWKLANAMNETVQRTAREPVNTPPYEFANESVLDCIRVGQQMLVEDAVDFQETLVSTDELIAEAAIQNNPRVRVLVETVFSTIKEKAIKFFEKAKAVALGIINRLKEFVLKFTQKTSQWADAIEPRINAADAGGGFTAQTYNWNTRYVSSGISAGISKMNGEWKSKVQSKIRDSAALAAMKTSAGGGNIDSLAQSAESLKAELQDVVNRGHQIAASAYGVRAGSPDEVWNAVVVTAHGGDQQKVERQIGASAKAMLEAVRQSGSWIAAVQKTYEDHVANLETYRKSLESEGGRFDASGGALSGDAAHIVSDYIKTKYDYCIRVTQLYESYMTKGNSINIQLIQEMTRDYMNILTAYANKKGA